jgi:triosephosphate isomerase
MFIAGNWKMHKDLGAARDLAKAIVDAVGDPGPVRVAVCPPFISLDVVLDEIFESEIELGAQTMHEADEGAYTGEISALMLHSVGCAYVILGHSERRQYFGETDAGVNAKVQQALAHDLVPIVCVGETLAQRQAGDERTVVKKQIEGALADVEIQDADDVVIAYEPVWAIGTGETATPDQAQEMHEFIRTLLDDIVGSDMADDMHVLYGGSMKPHNAAELLDQDDVDGGLIGGASLKADAFAAIIEAGKNAA